MDEASVLPERLFDQNSTTTDQTCASESNDPTSLVPLPTVDEILEDLSNEEDNNSDRLFQLADQLKRQRMDGQRRRAGGSTDQTDSAKETTSYRSFGFLSRWFFRKRPKLEETTTICGQDETSKTSETAEVNGCFEKVTKLNTINGSLRSEAEHFARLKDQLIDAVVSQ